MRKHSVPTVLFTFHHYGSYRMVLFTNKTNYFNEAPDDLLSLNNIADDGETGWIKGPSVRQWRREIRYNMSVDYFWRVARAHFRHRTNRLSRFSNRTLLVWKPFVIKKRSRSRYNISGVFGNARTFRTDMNVSRNLSRTLLRVSYTAPQLRHWRVISDPEGDIPMFSRNESKRIQKVRRTRRHRFQMGTRA